MRKSWEQPCFSASARNSTKEGTMGKCDLQDSGVTSPTETGSVSEEENGGWFHGIGSGFHTLAISLRDTAGGVANFVHRTALAAAAEIAMLEHGGDCSDGVDVAGSETLRLPWEIMIDSESYGEDVVLKEKILALSQQERTFMKPFTTTNVNTEDADTSFVLDGPRIRLIRNLVELDEHLASTHARLSRRIDFRETVFWRNYLYNCNVARREHLEDFGGTADDFDSSEHGSQNSLVPDDIGLSSHQEDDSSFVCVSRSASPSPPASVNSTGIRSVDSLVFVEQSSPGRR